jgi:CheY-like chemotaxis protein
MTEPTQTILLAEEDPMSRSFLSEQLSFDGYEVIEADSRAKALAILGTRQPDMLIADVNGETLSLIDAVREADGLASRIDPGTPMLVLTARAEELARVRYLERGSDDVLALPTGWLVHRQPIGPPGREWVQGACHVSAKEHRDQLGLEVLAETQSPDGHVDERVASSNDEQ